MRNKQAGNVHGKDKANLITPLIRSVTAVAASSSASATTSAPAEFRPEIRLGLFLVSN
jgi:hypothetical protein